MTPRGVTPLPLRLVIFDCDGVLVDSETLANRVCAREVTALGWSLSGAEAMDRFMGLRLSDIPPMVAAHTGRPVPPDWVEHLRDRLVDVLGREVEAMPGAAEALREVAALGLAYRVASNSSHEEMAAKFARTGLASWVAGRVHSARDVARGKPAPDVFLAAAAAEGAPPGACLVVEDSVPGARAAAAAGMACVGLDPHGDGAKLRAEGAVHVRALAEVPAILRAALHRAA